MNKFAFIPLLVLILVSSGCQSLEMVPDPEGPEHPGEEFTRHYNYSHFAVTKEGNYSVELVFKDGTIKEGINNIDIIIHDRDNMDVTGAAVSIIPYMPIHQHSADMTPIVIERGGGTYSARNVDITMPGRWQLTVRVSTVRANDEAVFDLMIEPGGGLMETMHTPHDMQMGKDTGRTSVVSARQMFKVTYKAPIPIPLNRLHSWDLTISTPRREAVTGANIQVDGGMPAHGHNLSTRPVVVETSMPGKYRIDGMKFTMPGEWVVRLHIDSGLETDTAEFIFMVR